jgi:hypothetical protein
MVEGVRPRSIGAASPIGRDAIRNTDEHFAIGDGSGLPVQNARLSTVFGIGLEGMLALQSVDESQERDRAAHKRGKAMLAALSRLQRAVLGGDDPAVTLRALSELAVDGPPAADPGLAAILRAVVLRSRVEVARAEVERRSRSLIATR